MARSSQSTTATRFAPMPNLRASAGHCAGLFRCCPDRSPAILSMVTQLARPIISMKWQLRERGSKPIRQIRPRQVSLSYLRRSLGYTFRWRRSPLTGPPSNMPRSIGIWPNLLLRRSANFGTACFSLRAQPKTKLNDFRRL